MSEEPLVSIRGLVSSYPGVLAVDGATFDIPREQIVGLVGKNGAGKSTRDQDPGRGRAAGAGQILLDGQRPRLTTRAHARGARASVHPPGARAVPTMSVAENVTIGLDYPRHAGVFVSWRTMYDQARECSRIWTRRSTRARRSTTCRIAQQRLVMIARALLARARLLVLDEPTTSLTDEEIEHLHAVVRR